MCLNIEVHKDIRAYLNLHTAIGSYIHIHSIALAGKCRHMSAFKFLCKCMGVRVSICSLHCSYATCHSRIPVIHHTATICGKLVKRFPIVLCSLELLGA